MKPIVVVIISLGSCVVFSLGILYATPTGADKQFSDRVNLALRQVGHQLLLLEGDKRSTILPVQITGPNEFTLKLENSFNYDTLPELLHQAFLSYGIQQGYLVIIKDCKDNIPLLGYNQIAFRKNEVPCKEREQLSDCNNIVLSFSTPVKSKERRSSLMIPFYILAVLALIGLGVLWKKTRKKDPTLSEPASAIPLGNFNFDYRNQTLQLGAEQQTLTFRENKLLYFLANNTNEIIKRDTLIAEVWGEEGVIVGRSLDVFISRLRKLLKGDETVMIKNIHGVGYRLELKA